MRLLQSVVPGLGQTKRPQQRLLAHRSGLLLMLRSHATFRNLSHYSSYGDRTISGWYAREFDVVSLNKAATLQVTPPGPAQALVIDVGFIPKSGKKPYGLDRIWNGAWPQRKRTGGLSLGVVRHHGQLCLLIKCQAAPATSTAIAPETTRTGVYPEHDLSHLRDVITDSYYSK
jgi:hypothetical protein